MNGNTLFLRKNGAIETITANHKLILGNFVFSEYLFVLNRMNKLNNA